MKAKLLIFGFVFSSLLPAQVMWQIKSDTVIKWYYYDGDEFNGPRVDEAKWIPAYSWTQLNYDYEYLMKPERIEFENGVARFTCYRDSGLYTMPAWSLDSAFKKKYKSFIVDGTKFRYAYTAGNVWSRMQYGKGYFEIRFKNDDAYGMWPAFWLYGNNKDEIDFCELKGEKKNEIHIDVHCLKGCDHGYTGGSLFPKSFGGWIKITNALNKGYNVLAGEWQDGYVKWYLNGVGLGYYKGEFGSQKMNLIMGTGPSIDGKSFNPGVNASTKFPNSFDIDYVRVWYKDNKPKTDVPGQKHYQFDYLKSDNTDKSFLKKKVRYMYNKKGFANDNLTVSVLPHSTKSFFVTSLGKKIDYTINVYNKAGKIVLNKVITETFTELDLTTITNDESVILEIKAAGKIIKETLSLK